MPYAFIRVYNATQKTKTFKMSSDSHVQFRAEHGPRDVNNFAI